MRRLVIGIGNRLRGDDGVGPMLAEELPGRLPEALRRDLQVRCVQQLLPELSSEIAAVEAVLFIDAWQPGATETAPAGSSGEQTTPALIRLRPGSEASRGLVEAGIFSHHLHPHQLLQIASLLNGRAPHAWQLLIPSFRFDHGSELSSELRTLLPQAESHLLSWCTTQATAATGAQGTLTGHA